jgi:hypothetical protein
VTGIAVGLSWLLGEGSISVDDLGAAKEIFVIPRRCVRCRYESPIELFLALASMADYSMY